MSDVNMATISRTCILIILVSFCYGFPTGKGLTNIPTMAKTVTIEYTTLPTSAPPIDQTGYTTLPPSAPPIDQTVSTTLPTSAPPIDQTVSTTLPTSAPPIDQTVSTTLPTSAPPIDQTEPGSTKAAVTSVSSNSPTEAERTKGMTPSHKPPVKKSSVLDLAAAFGAVAVILLIVCFFVIRGLYQLRHESKLEIREIPLEKVTSDGETSDNAKKT